MDNQPEIDKDVVAVVPVREGSTRIKNKNFLPFGDHPTLIHRKIEHLKAAGCFEHIYLSSDSTKVKEIADECGVEFLEREPFMCTSAPRWSDVVCHILNTVPGNPHCMWAMVTSPLFVRYKEAVQCYLHNLNKNDSLVGVKKIQEYLIDEKGRPLFYSFGDWHPYSNELFPLYAINDTVFIAPKSHQIKWRYWLGIKPYLFEGTHLESIDINFPQDLEMAYAGEKILKGQS